METSAGIITGIICIALIMAGFAWRRRTLKKAYEMFREKDNSYTLIATAYDWGPVVDRMILNPGKIAENLTTEDLYGEKFKVICHCGEKSEERIPRRAYLCNIDGEALSQGEDAHIMLEFNVHPEDYFFSPVGWNEKENRGFWKEDYSYSISHSAFEKDIETLNDWILPEGDKFEILKTSGELQAAYFECENAKDGEKHPLVIWLHGAGEGGNDPSLAVMGNKVTALAGKEIQEKLGGAFVLVPQCPTVWMHNDSKPYDICSEECKDKSSKYTKELKEIIDSFIKDRKEIDLKRIYIGGCSNGGYMTINMLLKYQNFFAAAFPVCEAYKDSWLSDKDIEVLSKTPLWFTAAKNDGTIKVEDHSIPTVKRLKAVNENNVKFSLFEDVRDTSGMFKNKDGEPYEFNGHWSWIYLFNDKCRSEGEESIWKWLSEKQSYSM